MKSDIHCSLCNTVNINNLEMVGVSISAEKLVTMKITEVLPKVQKTCEISSKEIIGFYHIFDLIFLRNKKHY